MTAIEYINGVPFDAGSVVWERADTTTHPQGGWTFRLPIRGTARSLYGPSFDSAAAAGAFLNILRGVFDMPVSRFNFQDGVPFDAGSVVWERADTTTHPQGGWTFRLPIRGTARSLYGPSFDSAAAAGAFLNILRGVAGRVRAEQLCFNWKAAGAD